MTTLPLPTPAQPDGLDPAVVAKLDGMARLNVLWMLGRTGWLDEITTLLARMFDASTFPARDRELMILRIAHVTRTDYPIPQHRAFAQNLGMTDAEVEAALVDGPVVGLDAWGNRLCAICTEITERVTIAEDSLAALVEHYGENGATRAIWLMGWFNMLVRFVGSARVPLESGPDPYGGLTMPTTSR